MLVIVSARPEIDSAWAISGHFEKKVLEDDPFFVLARLRTQGDSPERDVIFEE